MDAAYEQREQRLNEAADGEFASYISRRSFVPVDRGGRRFGPKEMAFVERHYAELGLGRLAKRLGRTTHSIKRMATKLKVPGRAIPEADMMRYVSIVEAADITGLAPETVRDRADKDGVAKRYGGSAKLPALTAVPRAWAEKLKKEIKPLAGHAKEFQEAGWMSMKQAADYIGITRSGLSKLLLHKPELVTARMLWTKNDIGAHKRMLHPKIADDIRRNLDAQRLKASRMVSIKSIAADLGVKHGTIFARCKRYGIEPEVLMTTRNIFMAFVSKEDAARVSHALVPPGKTH